MKKTQKVMMTTACERRARGWRGAGAPRLRAWPALGVLLLLALMPGRGSAAPGAEAGVGAGGSPEGLRVALHAQSKHSEHGWVAGSEITTAGIKRALEALPGVAHVQIFATFSYAGLRENGPWDLAIVEGHAGSVPAFIRAVRDSHPEQSVVVHYCLDTYPSLDQIMRLDVDAYFTNSRILLARLQKIAPSAYFPLAVDADVMHPDAATRDVTTGNRRFKHNVVYVGHNSPGKKHLTRMLTEAAPFGLAIYGHPGWRNAPPQLSSLYQGVLPPEDLPRLYSSAKVVIGTTELKQQRLGMINNRLYEALACGATFISDALMRCAASFLG